MNWKTLTKTAKRTLSRNGSKILLGFGIAGASGMWRMRRTANSERTGICF